MRLSGTLQSWQDERGFGFIAPTHGGAELFVHASAMPRDGSRPTVGEKLSYELGRGPQGRPQAINVRREAIASSAVRARRDRGEGKRSGRPLVKGMIVLLLLATLGAVAFDRYRTGPAVSAPAGSWAPQAIGALPSDPAVNFRCDGRTHCSQMSSCAEAKYVLAHCPSTKMDGNGDGTPCEQQWCTSPFSR